MKIYFHHIGFGEYIHKNPLSLTWLYHLAVGDSYTTGMVQTIPVVLADVLLHPFGCDLFLDLLDQALQYGSRA